MTQSSFEPEISQIQVRNVVELANMLTNMWLNYIVVSYNKNVYKINE
jgi:hypothetical protein